MKIFIMMSIYGNNKKVDEENEKTINGGEHFKGVKGFSNKDFIFH